MKVCGFNGNKPYTDYNRKHSRHIHLIYVQTNDLIEPSSWVYRSLCHLDDKHKICLETQISDYEVSVIQQWLRKN